MRASEILNTTQHRDFDIPKRSWKFYQEWNKAIFMHWEVEPEAVKPFLPSSVALDTINEKAWISMVAFDMNHIGIRSLPKIPHISDFHEVNIRTYIVCKGKPSVYFLSMEGSKRSSCKILKVMSKFPYVHAKINRTDYSYQLNNSEESNSLEFTYRTKMEPCKKDKTDLWLTERYAVFQEYKQKLIEYDVHHVEWPLDQITIKDLTISYPKYNHLINNSPDRMHYSDGVEVLTWDKRKYQL